MQEGYQPNKSKYVSLKPIPPQGGSGVPAHLSYRIESIVLEGLINKFKFSQRYERFYSKEKLV